MHISYQMEWLMSVELLFTSSYIVMKRHLSKKEKALLRKMLDSAGNLKDKFLNKIDSALVQEMNDGGMGSLRFIAQGEGTRRLGQVVSEAEFLDEDGVLVTVTLNLDQNGRLYELDIWKTDFSPLKKIPDSKKVVISKPKLSGID